MSQLIQQGVTAQQQQDFQTAEQCYRQVLEQNPDHPDAIHFMGVLAYQVGNYEAAHAYISRAIELLPENDACYNNMGNLYQVQNDYQAAIPWYEKTIALNPDKREAYNNLGVAYTRIGEYRKAGFNLEHAIEISPAYAEAYNNLGEVYRAQNDCSRAIEMYEKAIDLQNDYVAPHWNRAQVWLLTRDFEQGWPAYEYRWRRPGGVIRLFDTGEPWTGQSLEGKTIFVYEEQGLGDTLQFMRFLRAIQNLGARVIFEVLGSLVRLVETASGFDRLWVGIRNVDTRPVDRFDYHVPLLSLPYIFNIGPETIPNRVPYLSADKGLSQIWKRRFRPEPRLKIGVVWAGSTVHKNDMNRSVMLSRFAGLARTEGVALYSLQKDKVEKWTDAAPEDIFVQDFGDEVSDFADTAAVMDHLDLVISVDTAVVHLAGAMAKEVWVLLPFSPDWRWMLDRTDSPWYPTMTLFRQPAPGDWDTVFNTVAQTLTQWLNQKKSEKTHE